MALEVCEATVFDNGGDVCCELDFEKGVQTIFQMFPGEKMCGAGSGVDVKMILQSGFWVCYAIWLRGALHGFLFSGSHLVTGSVN